MKSYPKTKQIKLKGKALTDLKLKVWERDLIDGYPVCQHCFGANNSPIDSFPHHIIFKSKIRLDVIWNLITLCRECHRLVHARLLFVNLEFEFTFENPKYSSGDIIKNEYVGQHHHF